MRMENSSPKTEPLVRVAALLALASFFCLLPASSRPSPADLPAASPCASAVAQHRICKEANQKAVDELTAHTLSGIVMMQDVRSGTVIVLDGMAPGAGGIGVRHEGILPDGTFPPLSTVKLTTAAIWWEHKDSIDPEQQKNAPDVHEMLVSGADDPGRRLALLLRKTVGSEAVIAGIARFGIQPCAEGQRVNYYSPPSCDALSAKTADADWASALSIGESHIYESTEELSHFLQAVGNGGIMAAAPPASAPTTSTTSQPARRIMSVDTAQALQSAMLDSVDHGSAKGIRDALGSGWRIGGKTGTGPATAHPYDGVFAGLVFDESGAARFTVLAYARHSGPGGGLPAEVAAAMAKFVLGL
jgi:hypothetical protein